MNRPSWVVHLRETEVYYGPFYSEDEAKRFADYLYKEVDPAAVHKLQSALDEMLRWHDSLVRAVNEPIPEELVPQFDLNSAYPQALKQIEPFNYRDPNIE